MQHLWSPWRMQYLEAIDEPDGGCIFCAALARGEDEAAYVLARSERSFAVLNAYPYNPGHLMVAPLRHVGDLEALQTDELSDAQVLVRRSVRALRETASPDGYNVGLNLGRVAGAGVPGHLHWHVIPRWDGDTNFITLVGQTRVLPELLAETYAKLKPRF